LSAVLSIIKLQAHYVQVLIIAAKVNAVS